MPSNHLSADQKAESDRLRDRYAGLAMQAMLTRIDFPSPADMKAIAERSWQMADEMLLKRDT